MSFLLDTCVVSEAVKGQRDLGVQTWLERVAPEKQFFSSLTFGEVKFGIERLAKGSKRDRLEKWFAEYVSETPETRVLPVDREVALRWAELRIHDPNCKLVDVQIAATALVHGLTLVTRNVRDFPFPGLAVFNPWSK